MHARQNQRAHSNKDRIPNNDLIIQMQPGHPVANDSSGAIMISEAHPTRDRHVTAEFHKKWFRTKIWPSSQLDVFSRTPKREQ